MKINFTPFIFIILPLMLNLTLTTSLSGQNCSEKLSLAEELFEEGLVERLPGLLYPCIEEGFTNDQKIKAYKLVILAYYYDDAVDEARKTMQNFIKSFPDYRPDSTDAPRFITLFNSFEKKKFLSLGIHAGSHYPFPAFLEPADVYADGMVQENKYSFVSFPYRTGLNIDLFLTNRTELSLDISLGKTLLGNSRILDLGTETLRISYNERYTTLDMPLYLTYQLNERKVQPYLILGSHLSYVLNATTGLEMKSSAAPGITVNEWDVTNARYDLAASLLAGCGIRYYLKKSYFFMELRYIQGISNHRKHISALGGDNAPSVLDEALWSYLYAEDNFRVCQAGVSVGYRIFFYKIGQK